MKKSWLFNKNVIISGASGGLGFNLAKTLIEKYNCNVLGIARNESKILSSIQNLGDKKDKFSYVLFDVSDNQNWEDFSKHLIDINFLPDVIINNAGFMLPFAKFEKYSLPEIEEITKTNFLSVVYSTKFLLPLLNNSTSPAIINISSSAGLCAVVGQSMYCATKSAVKGFTETLQQEYKNQIFISGIYPGFIKTDILNRQNIDTKSNRLINKLMMPLDKATKKIIKGIKRKKKRIIFGFDGMSLNIFGRLFPKATPSLVAKVLKASKLDLFSDVF